MNTIILVLFFYTLGIWFGLGLAVHVELKKEMLEKIFGALSLVLFGGALMWIFYNLLILIFSFL